MKVEFTNSFEKDLKKIKDKSTKNKIKDKIEAIEQTDNIYNIQEIKKLSGGKGYYRIRLGDYRIGIKFESGKIIFIRFLHRKDIYKYFP